MLLNVDAVVAAMPVDAIFAAVAAVDALVATELFSELARLAVMGVLF